MKVLLTGGCGYIGSHTAALLLSRGHDVVIVDNMSNVGSAMSKNSSGLITKASGVGKSPSVYVNDVLNEHDLLTIFFRERVDAVIHLAGLKSVAESFTSPVSYFETNVAGTLAVAKAMTAVGITKLVFSSSATVYGHGGNTTVMAEGSECDPTSPYAETKLFSERMLLRVPQLETKILRYFNPIGAHPSGLLGENPRGKPNNLMPVIINAVKTQVPVTVFGTDYPTDDGTCIRDYVHVMDIAVGHVLALETPGSFTINLGTGKGTSVRQLIRTFQEVNQVSVPWVCGARRPGDNPAFWASTERAKEILGFKVQHTLDEMCKSAWEFGKQL